MRQIYLDNAGNLSYKERLAKELTFLIHQKCSKRRHFWGVQEPTISGFLIKVKSKTTALSNIIGDL